MTVTVQLPRQVEDALRSVHRDIEAHSRESLLVAFYRQRLLTHHQLAEALGLDRFETDAVLNKHHVTDDLPSLDELRQQMELSRTLQSGR
jgi:hypothetical protein